jgi:hypothetical protein
MALQFGSTQTESVQVPSQSAPGIASGLLSALGAVVGFGFGGPVGAGLGATVGGGLGGAIGSGMTETQTYDVAAAPQQQMGLAQALTEMDLPAPPPPAAVAGIGDIELDSTFGAAPSYLDQPPPPFYG